MKITEATTISVGVVVVLVGAVLYVTRVEGRVNVIEATTLLRDEERKEYAQIVKRVDRRLGRIEGKLGLTRWRDGD